MSIFTATARFLLPYIKQNQARKEKRHNEGLDFFDALVGANVLDRDLTAPPGSPANGDMYIPKAPSTGLWTGMDGKLAFWNAPNAAWKAIPPKAGLFVRVADENIFIVYDGAAWADIFGTVNALVYKGPKDCSANPNYPAADAGDTYIVSVAGKIGGASGVTVEVGDLLICKTDGSAAGTQAAVGANWDVIQTNTVGAVSGPASATDNGFARWDGTTGKLLKDSSILATLLALFSNMSEVTIAAAGSIDLTVTTSPKIFLSGSATPTVWTVTNSAFYIFRFNGNVALTESAAVILNNDGNNYTTSAGDTAFVTVSSAGVMRWRIFRADGSAVGTTAVGKTLVTAASKAAARAAIDVDQRITVGDAAYAMASTDRHVVLTALLTAPRVWELPLAASVNPGAAVQVVDEAQGISASNTLSVSRKVLSSDTVNGQTSVVFDVGGSSPEFCSDGVSKWTTDIIGVNRGGTGGKTQAAARTGIGIGNVDNTSDANKPVSTAQQTALDLKAPLASPGLTGTPTVPTAAADTSTTQAASTAFMIGQAGTSTPTMAGTGAVGTSKRYTRDDHVHPSDTTRAALAGATFTGAVLHPNGSASAPSIALNTNYGFYYDTGNTAIGIAAAGAQIGYMDSGAVAISFSRTGGGLGATITGEGTSGLTSATYSASGAAPANVFIKGRGTIATPLKPTSGDDIAIMRGRGYAEDSVQPETGAELRFTTKETTWTSTARGTYASFQLVALGATAFTEALRIDPDNGLQIGGANTVITADRRHRLRTFTVATLPTAVEGDLTAVTDATLTMITGLGVAPTGGGANHVPVYADNAGWKII